MNEEKQHYNTEVQQRSLLHHLFSNPHWAQKFFTRVSEDLFDNKKLERRWLFKKAREVFQATQTCLTEELLKAELGFAFVLGEQVSTRGRDGKKTTKIVEHEDMTHASIMIEWNFVQNSPLDEYPEQLILFLEKTNRAQQTIDLLNRATEQIACGMSDEAISELSSSLIGIKSGNDKCRPLRDYYDFEWRRELIINRREHPELYAGIGTCYRKYDNKIGGLFRGELVLFSGHTGGCKSTLTRNFIRGARNNGANVLYITNEEVDDQVTFKFDSMITAIDFRQFKRGLHITDEDLDRLAGEIKKEEEDTKIGRLWVQQIGEFTDCSVIESTIADMRQQGKRLDVLVLDYLDHLKPVERAFSEYDEQNKAIREFKGLCMRYNLAGLTNTQADTPSFGTDTRSSYNVRGSKQKSGAANVVAFIIPVSDEDDPEKVFKILITKSRDGETFSFFVKFEPIRQLLVEVDDESGFKKKKDLDEKLNKEMKESKVKKRAVVKEERPVRRAAVICDKSEDMTSLVTQQEDLLDDVQ